ncbi:MAG: 16S rRNA (uracil(1498)-N(3))-methyltransferase [Candidatus Omnitrophica bacterium]|nr:16S rRNA (uracil(1498)-N(3))-methyltransferase [Candidatus Omnitrophota bacterium]
MMHRVFVPPEDIKGSTITIANPKDVHHLVRVLRLRAGDGLECFDGSGAIYDGVIDQCASGQVRVAVRRHRQVPAQQRRIALAMALLPADRFDWAIQKATELGAAQIIPLVTERTIIRLTKEQGQRKVGRWQAISREAAQQCGQAVLPIIESPQRFAELTQRFHEFSRVLLPTLGPGTIPLREVLSSLNPQPPAPSPQPTLALSSMLVCIGPEGDFTPQEVRHASAAGAVAVSLGRAVLRSETAAISVLAVLLI